MAEDKNINICQDNSGIANSGDNNTINQTNHINKKYFFKASNLVIVGAGLLIVVGITLLVSSNGINRSFNNISDSNITINYNKGIDKDTFNSILNDYRIQIKELKTALKSANSPEAKAKITQELAKLEQDYQTKQNEIEQAQKTLESLSFAITQKANEIYKKEGIDKTIEYLQKIDEANQKKILDKSMLEFAQKYKLQAELLITKNRYDEAKKAYAQMTHYDRSFDALFEYALFLAKQNYFAEAIKAHENLLDLELSQANRALVLNNLANLYSDQNQNKQALQAYQEALSLYKDLAKANPLVYNPDVAMTLNNLANLYRAQNQNQQALQAYQEALSLRRELAKANPSVYNPYVAGILNNLAVLYSDQNQHQQALQAYQEALSLRRELALANPWVYHFYVASTLDNLGILYQRQNKNKEALKTYQEALTIRRELALANPSIFNPHVAGTLNNLALLY